jgi:Tol biopolymer transport system component
LALVSAGVCGVVIAAEQPGVTVAGFRVVEERLGAVPENVVQITPGPGFERVVCVVRHGEKWAVIVDGKTGPEYNEIGDLWQFIRGGKHTPIFSPDGKRVAYVARKGHKWQVIVDGQAGPEYDLIVEPGPFFEPDGKHVTYTAQIGDKFVTVKDGQPGPEHDLSPARFPRVVTDGQPAAEYELVHDVVSSRDGLHRAFVAAKEWVLVDDWPFRIRRAVQEVVVVDGREGPAYLRVFALNLSPDGRRVAYSVWKDLAQHPNYFDPNSWFCVPTGASQIVELVVVDGKEQSAYDRVDCPFFSPDGRHVAYEARKGNKWQVIVDGQAGPEFRCVWYPTFSPDGKRLAYVAMKDEKCLMVVDSQVGPEYDNVYKGRLAFSNDSRHYAYSAQKGGKWLVVVDGQEGAQFAKVVGDSLVFSPDGRILAYVACNKGKERVLLAGEEGPEYDEIIRGGPVFSADGTLKHLAIKDRTMLRALYVPARN